MIGSVSTQFPALYTAFVISLSVHLLFLYPWLPVRETPKAGDPIPVAFIPAPRPEPKVENVKVDPPKIERKEKIVREITPPHRVAKLAEPHRPVQQKSSPAEEATPPVVKTPALPEGVRWRSEEAEMREVKTDPVRPDPEMHTIVRRPLPTLKDLLPPVDWATTTKDSSAEEGAIRLDSQDPNYVSYLSGIKRAIELVWEYPVPALSQGIQGKLVVEFTVLGDGSLSGARLIRSSGFSILDEEALRAVRSAAPFYPIPPWIHKKRLAIIASFEYFDNRLRYSYTPEDTSQLTPQSGPPQP